MPAPTICMRCECPLPPYRFVDEWPLNGRRCECPQPHEPSPVALDVRELIELGSEVAA